MNKKKYSKEEIIIFLQNKARELNQVPTRAYFNKERITPSLKTIKEYFGSWSNALTEAGLEVKISSKGFTPILKKNYWILSETDMRN